MTDAEKLRQLIEQAEKLVSQRTNHSKPEFGAWHSKTERFLDYKFGSKSVEMKNFKKRPFGPTSFISGVPQDASVECLRDLEATILELKEYLSEEDNKNDSNDRTLGLKTTFSDKVFIVHGHNGELKEAIARLIESQGIGAIILSEQANQGKTIIEKFEKYSDVGAAIALFTNDDLGRKKDSNNDMPRARQNVVLEAGYFMGKLGRNRVVIVAEKGIELPSDLQGVVYTDKADWKLDVCRELKAMNYAIDVNKLL